MGRDPGLSPEHARDALEQLAPITDVVLIGGQAVAHWAARYGSRCQEIQHQQPLTTKDIDFIGTQDQALRSAKILGG